MAVRRLLTPIMLHRMQKTCYKANHNARHIQSQYQTISTEHDPHMYNSASWHVRWVTFPGYMMFTPKLLKGWMSLLKRAIHEKLRDPSDLLSPQVRWLKLRKFVLSHLCLNEVAPMYTFDETLVNTNV